MTKYRVTCKDNDTWQDLGDGRIACVDVKWKHDQLWLLDSLSLELDPRPVSDPWIPDHKLMISSKSSIRIKRSRLRDLQSYIRILQVRSCLLEHDSGILDHRFGYSRIMVRYRESVNVGFWRHLLSLDSWSWLSWIPNPWFMLRSCHAQMSMWILWCTFHRVLKVFHDTSLSLFHSFFFPVSYQLKPGLPCCHGNKFMPSYAVVISLCCLTVERQNSLSVRWYWIGWVTFQEVWNVPKSGTQLRVVRPHLLFSLVPQLVGCWKRHSPGISFKDEIQENLEATNVQAVLLCLESSTSYLEPLKWFKVVQVAMNID